MEWSTVLRVLYNFAPGRLGDPHKICILHSVALFLLSPLAQPIEHYWNFHIYSVAADSMGRAHRGIRSSVNKPYWVF